MLNELKSTTLAICWNPGRFRRALFSRVIISRPLIGFFQMFVIQLRQHRPCKPLGGISLFNLHKDYISL